MGWNTHPDTLCMAMAQGAAERTEHKAYSRGWRISYRNAYQKVAEGEPGLEEYLALLDKKIAEMPPE